MNFVTIEWELSDGSLTRTLVEDYKASNVVKELKAVTKAWIVKD